MNAVIHLFAALGSMILVIYILRLQRRRDFLLHLVKSLGATSTKLPVRIALPSQFLAEFSAALGIPFSAGNLATEQMAKINPRVWMETFLSYGFDLIRLSGESAAQGVEVQVKLHNPVPADRDLVGALTAALGGQVRVAILSTAD